MMFYQAQKDRVATIGAWLEKEVSPVLAALAVLTASSDLIHGNMTDALKQLDEAETSLDASLSGIAVTKRISVLSVVVEIQKARSQCFRVRRLLQQTLESAQEARSPIEGLRVEEFVIITAKADAVTVWAADFSLQSDLRRPVACALEE